MVSHEFFSTSTLTTKTVEQTIFYTLENMAHYGFVFTSDRQCFVLFKWRYTVLCYVLHIYRLLT